MLFILTSIVPAYKHIKGENAVDNFRTIKVNQRFRFVVSSKISFWLQNHGEYVTGESDIEIGSGNYSLNLDQVELLANKLVREIALTEKWRFSHIVYSFEENMTHTEIQYTLRFLYCTDLKLREKLIKQRSLTPLTEVKNATKRRKKKAKE